MITPAARPPHPRPPHASQNPPQPPAQPSRPDTAAEPATAVSEPREAPDANAADQDVALVVLMARDVRLPDVLRHLEAGRTVRIIADAPPGETGK
ncbi:VanW family protein [Pseudofrankia inefficax]|uniref:VanW family protein n=1 Tax=Pseudofrankia inefficax (strain DSM 45817 / CECT 9037 / DDB 130130 / EuI1c) TaxID=298654 RepID=E3J8T1_PSEI1|nr:VanW family protein [Pseudofrankia inefficax]